MALTLTPETSLDAVYEMHQILGKGVGIVPFSLAFDSSYPTGGETPSVVLDSVLFHGAPWCVVCSPSSGYQIEYDYTNKKFKVLSSAYRPATAGIIDDTDAAATSGADLQIAISDHVADAIEENAMNEMFGRLEAINAGNATVSTNQVGTAVAATNPTFTVWDNDNAETETAVMADLFCAPAGGGFFAVTLSGLDTYVPLSNGEFLKVTYDADPASNQTAVQVYYDDNATNANERLQCVAVDNADETFTVAADLTLRPNDTVGLSEVASTTDLSALTAVKGYAIGRLI
jgi:hypothetical protein